MYDLIIKNGVVVDGTGSARFSAEIAVKDGIIAAIGTDLGEAVRVIDADGKIVAPGFIDAHSHTDNTVLFEQSDGYNKLEQGATTEVAGQCGSAPVPYYKSSLDEAVAIVGQQKVDQIKQQCADFESFMTAVEQVKMGANIAFFAGQGAIRGKVMGFSDAEPSEQEVEQMCALMNQAMEQGFLGFTTGLVYAPSVYAGKPELVELAKVTKKHGGVYASHIRGEGNQLLDSMKEAIDIGEAGGVPVIISHLKVIGKNNEGDSIKALDLIEKSNERGIDVRADQYPYLGGSAPFLSQIPPKFLTDGPAALLERMAKPEVRDEIEHSIFNEYDEFESNIYSAGYDGTLMAGCSKTPQYVGKTIGEIAKEEGKRPIDVTCDILIANNGHVQGIYFAQNQSDMMRIISHPTVMGGSDWSAYLQHQSPDKVSGGHPRGTSTFVKRMELIRDHGLLTLEQSVYSITGFAAESLNLNQIGKLQVGKNADICIFDYAALRAPADFIHPFARNEGILTVIVNGQVAVENGVFNGTLAGKVLKRKK